MSADKIEAGKARIPAVRNVLANWGAFLCSAIVGASRLVLILGGLIVAVSLVSGVFGGIITARQRFDIISSVQISVEMTRALLVVLALRSGYGIVALAAIQLTILLARGIIDF